MGIMWLERLFRKSAPPAFWQTYLEQARQTLPGNTPLRDIPFAVLDTETTGLNPAKDAILSIGGVKVQHGTIAVAQSLELFLEQLAVPQQKDIAIHGIMPAVSTGQTGIAEAMQQFTAWCGASVLVGHHIAFDLSMLNTVLQNLGCGKLRNPSLDTLQLHVRLRGSKDLFTPGELSLDALAAQYHIALHDRHTALGDAYITAILLLKLLHRLEQRGVKTLRQLLARRSMPL